jgi:predicted DNA-binding transcriptional regulator AlpA
VNLVWQGDDMLDSAPTLVELARDPGRAADIPLSAVPPLLAQLAALQAALAARLVRAPIEPNRVGRDEAPESERLLMPSEAAALLGVTVSWLYRHAGRLPFARRLSRKALRFSESGLRRWLATKKS